ncbi:MAG: TlpA family protein disulfide reductase [Anaerolineales bacterium]
MGEEKRPLWRWLLTGLAVGLGLGLIIFFGIPSTDRDTEAPAAVGRQMQQPLVGEPAPAFSTTDSQGAPIALQDFSGQVVLLNFWATWCGPCEVEMPLLQQRYEALRDQGFVVLAINYDESREKVVAFGDRLGLDFPLLLDRGGEIQRSYQVRGYPSSYLVDEEGIIRDVHIGLMTDDQLEEMLAMVGLED